MNNYENEQHSEDVRDIRHLPPDARHKKVRDMMTRIGCIVTAAAVGERRLQSVILHRIGAVA